MGRKNSSLLATIEAKAELKYSIAFHAKVGMLMQMGQDAAMIAANEVLQMGKGRAESFCVAYREAINEMARMVVDDAKDDKDFVYAKAKIDDKIRSIVGDDKFSPWEERYGEK